jgi:hypothetical protein
MFETDIQEETIKNARSLPCSLIDLHGIAPFLLVGRVNNPGVEI